jgi:hypothetical protein
MLAAGRALRATVLAFSFLCCSSNSGSKPRHNTLGCNLNADSLGEKLKRFKSLHPGAKCTRHHEDDFVEGVQKHTNELSWVSCNLTDGVAVGGYSLLSAGKSKYPLGMYADFRGARYVLAAQSVGIVLPTLREECGDPTYTLMDNDKALLLVRWVRSRWTLVAERVPVRASIDGEGVLKVTDLTQVYAIDIDLSAGVPVASDGYGAE